MNIRVRPLLSLTAAVVTVLALTACSTAGPSGNSATDAGETITVYNAQHDNLTKAWVEGFTAATGIRVAVRNGEDPEMAQQLIQEGKNSRADVFLTENSPAISAVENAGLFASPGAEALSNVPGEYTPATKKWVGIAARSTVLAYDKSKLAEGDLPASLLDLAKPEWKGRWAASPSGADFQAIVSALVQLKGERAASEWLAAMKANAQPYKGNSTAMKAVNAGQVDAAVIYHYYWYSDQSGTGENSKNVGLHFFKNQDPGAFVSLSGGGVLASSKHKAAAQRFLAYITGEDGQKVLQDGSVTFEYPVASGVAAHRELPALDDLEAPKIDPSTLNSKLVTDLMTKAGLL